MLPFLAVLSALAMQQGAALVHCQFRPTVPNMAWTGSCGRLFGQAPTMTLALGKPLTSGRWRSDVNPIEVWAGDMTDQGFPNAPIELEVYRASEAGTAGVLRTEYGWYMVMHYHEGDDSLAFEIDTARTVPSSDLDREIAKRADAILSSDAVWNRADNRICPPTATSWSIYCAMQRAGIDVTGGAHHRRPAMELVRQLLDERSAGRNYSHRLMDYNNDPRTTLADVHSLFVEALARMNAPALGVSAGAKAGSAPPASGLPPVTQEDLRVAERAAAILGAADGWNRHETQTCAVEAKSFGLYCALKAALEQVTGRFDESSVVLSEARAIVDFVASKRYSARLVNYNNDPDTSFADIQAFFRILRNRLVRRAQG